MELFGRRKDGSEFPAAISLSTSQEGDSPHVTSIIRDVTVEKRNERAVAEPRSDSSWQRRLPTSASGT